MRFGVSRLHDRKYHVPRKPLPLIVSPVDLKRSPSHQDSISQPLPEAGQTPNPADLSQETSYQSQNSNPSTRSTHVVFFKPRHESTAIELFYDLFFVANLTVFTENSEISSTSCMSVSVRKAVVMCNANV